MPTRALDVILAALALLGPFAIHLFFPVIPIVKVDFELSDALAQLTFSICVFGMAFSTLAYGTFADRYGRRPVLLIGLSLFSWEASYPTSPGSFASLLIGKLVQSIGAGCGITLARAIARDAYGASGLVKAIAYLTMFFALGGLLAPGSEASWSTKLDGDPYSCSQAALGSPSQSPLISSFLRLESEPPGATARR